jgi:hypothetical protein
MAGIERVGRGENGCCGQGERTGEDKAADHGELLWEKAQAWNLPDMESAMNATRSRTIVVG